MNKLNTGSYDRGAGFISNFSCRDWLCAEYGHTQIQALGRMADWLEGETAEGFFSQPGEKFWADAEYAADCHCCGALSKV